MKRPPTRQLHFVSLGAAVDEARHLLEVGYRSTGNWTLAQAAGHCAEWIDYSMNGRYPVPILMRPISAIVNRTIGNRLLRSTLASRRMSAGGPTFPASVPPPLPKGSAGDEQQHSADAAAVQRLSEAAQRLASWKLQLPRSPIFGKLNLQDAIDLHCIHVAHHLGYLVPNDDA